MADESTSRGMRPVRYSRDAYPGDLGAFVAERWKNRPGATGPPDRDAVHPLPEASMLEEVLSACYQASLLREEEQPVTFRLALCGPEVFSAEEGPPNGLHCLEFSDPRPFDAQELRRLSSATDYPRSIVGARYDGTQGLRIWGLVHTGPRWLRDRRGGRVIGPPLPPLPIVHVTGPGRLEVRKGSGVVARLENSALADASMDVFESEWLPAGFATVRAELMELHLAARDRARERDGELWAPLDPDLARKISQQMFKRLISTVQNFRRGGTVIFVPPERTEEFYEKDGFVALKYRFAEGEPRRRFRTLIVRTMNRLAQAHGSADSTSVDEVQDPSAVGWTEYQESNDKEVATLEEAIMEVAHLVAALATTDGAVVMSKRYELLGFGGEISGKLADVETVLRALDIEGDEFEEEPTESVGTRHRSAYRLCKELPDVLAVVVSKDGDVSFIRQLEDGEVAYWDQG